LGDWFTRVRTGQVLLPRFQRHEAWGHREITALVESVLRGLPTGAALTLEIGDNEPFFARPLVGAPDPTERVTEHLLDGQQRLTALWRSLHDDYDDRVYLIDTGDAADPDGESIVSVRSEPTHHKNGSRYPLWLDNPAECWKRGLIPLALCRPGAPVAAIDQWVDDATTEQGQDPRALDRAINRYANTIESFNIPFLSLPPGTQRETALEVFINMNTSSVKLSSYDIVVAQYEAATGESLHDQVAELEAAVPRLASYRSAENLLLDIAALREDHKPSQASYHQLDLVRLGNNFDEIEQGASFAVEVLEAEGIFDSDRLPTVAVLPVLGALEPHVPKAGDERGNAMTLVRSYLWRAFTTSRYESSAGTRVLQDLRGLISTLQGGENTAPIFDEELFRLPLAEDLIRARWPKTRQTLARAILCASLRHGAYDLADGAKATPANMIKREYHHLFPEAYLAQAQDVDTNTISRALNCSLITWTTNRRIGAKPPLTYLRERVELSNLGEDEVKHRLQSHLIPWDEFANPSSDDVALSYQRFVEARAELMADYLAQLCVGAEPRQ